MLKISKKVASGLKLVIQRRKVLIQMEHLNITSYQTLDLS